MAGMGAATFLSFRSLETARRETDESRQTIQMASRTIPMATSYVVWGGVGAVGTTIVGIIWFGEPTSATRIALIVAVIACIAGLKAAA